MYDYTEYTDRCTYCRDFLFSSFLCLAFYSTILIAAAPGWRLQGPGQARRDRSFRQSVAEVLVAVR